MNRLDTEPIRAGIYCSHCSEEIQATAFAAQQLVINGCYVYEWKHVESGSPECVQVLQARPYDGWAASKAVEAERRRLYALQDEERA